MLRSVSERVALTVAKDAAQFYGISMNHSPRYSRKLDNSLPHQFGECLSHVHVHVVLEDMINNMEMHVVSIACPIIALLLPYSAVYGVIR